MSEEAELILQRVQVVYCGECGMPPEYCEYGPDFESHCLPWLKKNHPDLAAHLKTLRAESGTAGGAGRQGEKEKETKETDTRPLAPWTTEQRLTAFYEKYQPDKTSDVPTLLEKYAGKEDKLFLALVKKYGPEPDDPYYDDSEDDEDDDDDDDEGSDQEGGGGTKAEGNKKRRGARAKTAQSVQTRVVIEKEQRNRKKATTIVRGMETVPGIKLKDVAKAFSKRFAGSSSVKDAPKSEKSKQEHTIIIQGDHMEDVAEMLVGKFQVPADCIFLNMGGDIVSYA